jgi:sulfatase maturation enzyme AslB (radical SAM superfamily)
MVALKRNTAQCALPLISAQVLSDGTTSFCGCANFDGKSEVNIGNVNDDTLRDMFESERVRRLWDWAKHGVPDFCQTCSFHTPLSVMKSIPAAFAAPLKTFGG